MEIFSFLLILIKTGTISGSRNLEEEAYTRKVWTQDNADHPRIPQGFNDKSATNKMA